jgi:hypothetical protein
MLKRVPSYIIAFAVLLLNEACGSGVSLYYCNTSYLTSTGLGMVDGMYLFETPTGYSFIGARDICKTWQFPSPTRIVSFETADIMTNNPGAIQPSLASLSNPNNLNVFVNFLLTSPNDYWIGLGQDVNATTCPGSAISTVYESAWNFTWIDGTPLYRDTKGQGLAYFPMGEPSNNNGNEHYAATYNWGGTNHNLNDAACGNNYRALCSVPR